MPFLPIGRLVNRFFKTCPASGRVIGVRPGPAWLFPFTGILALIWILVRVIPNPSRLSYPCQQVAGSMVLTLIGYLAGGVFCAAFFKKIAHGLRHHGVAIGSTCALALTLMVPMYMFCSGNDSRQLSSILGPADLAGVITAAAYDDKTVVRVYDGSVCSFRSGDDANYYYRKIDADKLLNMLEKGLMELSATGTVADAWNAICPGINSGSKIAVKINLNNTDRSRFNSDWMRRCLVDPPMIIALTKSLSTVGIPEQNITYFDRSRQIPSTFRNDVKAQCPNVVMLGEGEVGLSGQYCKVYYNATNYYNMNAPSCLVDCNYFISLALIKNHAGGVTGVMKNLFGLTESVGSFAHQGSGWENSPAPWSLVRDPIIANKMKLVISEAIFTSRNGPDNLELFNNTAFFPNGLMSSVVLSRSPFYHDAVLYDFMNVELKNSLDRSIGSDSWLRYCAAERSGYANWHESSLGSAQIVNAGGNLPSKDLAYDPAKIRYLSVAASLATPPPPPPPASGTWTYSGNAEGWTGGTSGGQYDAADWSSSVGNPQGSLHFDGSDMGNPNNNPNSWFYKQVALPSNASAISLDARGTDATHGGKIRIRLVDNTGVSRLLFDWLSCRSSAWFRTSGNLSAYAGTTVTIYIEQNDFGGGNGEHVWVDNVSINVGSTQAPNVATAAAASPGTVTGTTCNLSVLGADDGGETNLTYTWAATMVPAGGSATFSVNGANAARNTVAAFTRAGNYTLQCTIRDVSGLTVTSSVNVTVSATLTTVAVTPSSASVAVSGTQQFQASAVDQFSQTLSAGYTWTASGGGTINSTGLFAAGSSTGGPFTVTASSGGKNGTASVMVTLPPASGTSWAFSGNTEGWTGGTSGGQYDAADWSSSVGNPQGSLHFDGSDWGNPNNNPNSWFYKQIALPSNASAISLDARGTDATHGGKIRIRLVDNTGVSRLLFDWLSCRSPVWFRASGNLSAYAGTTVTMYIEQNDFGGGNGEHVWVDNVSINAGSTQAPTVATAAVASPGTVTGSTCNLSVLGADDGGEINLTYTWAATTVPGGGSATFSVNGANAARNTVAAFTRAGNYTLQCTIRDGSGLTATSSVNVMVSATLTTVAVTPSSASVAVSGTQQFLASAVDQFGQTLSAGYTWTVSGGGTINSTGLFAAGSSTGGPFTVTASSGGKNGTASVTVTSAQTVTRLEAESGSYTNASVTVEGSASNGRYVDGSGWFELTQTYNSPSARTVALRYAITANTTGRKMGVFVNNVKVGVITTTTTRYTWAVSSISSVNFNAGVNTIELRDTEGTDEPDVDYLEIQ